VGFEISFSSENFEGSKWSSEEGFSPGDGPKQAALKDLLSVSRKSGLVRQV